MERVGIHRVSETPSMDIEAGSPLGRHRNRSVLTRDRSSPICKGWKELGKCKTATLAVSSFLLEAVSLFLDVCVKNQSTFLVAAFLLSVIGSAMVAYTCVVEENTIAAASRAERQLLAVEVAFSVVQLIVSFLAVLGVKQLNNYNASILLLVFVIIAAAFKLRKDRDISDSSHPTTKISRYSPVSLDYITKVSLDYITKYHETRELGDPYPYSPGSS